MVSVIVFKEYVFTRVINVEPFTVSCTVNGVSTLGTAPSKKQARQLAAKEMLEK